MDLNQPTISVLLRDLEGLEYKYIAVSKSK
jgi:hypothetical protein